MSDPLDFSSLPQPSIQLDWSYITSRIAIISSPLKNDTLSELKSFLTKNFNSTYKIFDFSSENEYKLEQDIENVFSFPIYSGTSSTLELLIRICTLIEDISTNSLTSIIILHCSTGLNRSCLIAALILLHKGYIKDINKLIYYIREKRLNNNYFLSKYKSQLEKLNQSLIFSEFNSTFPSLVSCLTLPSNIRYLHYYKNLLESNSNNNFYRKYFKLVSIRLSGDFSLLISSSLSSSSSSSTSFFSAGISPYVDILNYKKINENKYVGNRLFHQLDNIDNITSPLNSTSNNYSLNYKGEENLPTSSSSKLISSSLPYYNINLNDLIEINFNNLKNKIILYDDIILSFYSNNNKLFQLSLNTCFFPDSGYLKFNSNSIDLLNNKKKFYNKNFNLEILTIPINESEYIFYTQDNKHDEKLNTNNDNNNNNDKEYTYNGLIIPSVDKSISFKD